MADYEPKAKTIEITATSRAAIKIRDNFYTVEHSEKRSVPDIEGINLDKERQFLWDDVNNVVDDQISDIIKMSKSQS